MAYSMDLRKRVVAAVEAGGSLAEVSRRFDVSRPAVRDWCARAKQGRLEANRPGPTKPRKFTPDDDQFLLQQVRLRPGITARELVGLLHNKVSLWSVCRRLSELGLSLKKSRSLLRNKSGPTS
jgi:transposase